MSISDELVRANAVYAAGADLANLPGAPRRRFAVLTCMDTRLDPNQFLGLRLGDAHVLRNAGAIVTEDVLRSLAVSHMNLGTQEVLVIGHSGCGLATFANEELWDRLRRELGADPEGFDFLPFPDVEQNVRDGVRRIRAWPLLPDSYTATGFVFDTVAGTLSPVDA